MWGYIIDGILILALLVSTIIGIVKGFFDSLLSLLGTGVAFIVAIFTAKYLSSTLNKIINIEQFVLGKLDGAGTSTNFFGHAYANTEIAKFCVWVVTVLVLFLLIKLVIFVLAKIFESVSKNSPTVSGINRVFGMFFGLAKGAVWVVVMLVLCSSVSQVPVIGSAISDKIGETKITHAVYKYVDDFVEKQLTKEKIDGIIAKLTTNDENQTTDTQSTESTPSSEVTE